MGTYWMLYCPFLFHILFSTERGNRLNIAAIHFASVENHHVHSCIDRVATKHPPHTNREGPHQCLGELDLFVSTTPSPQPSLDALDMSGNLPCKSPPRQHRKTLSSSSVPGTAIRRLADDDVRSIFECLHHQAPLPPHLRFSIIPVGPTGLKLSPPSYEFVGMFMKISRQRPIMRWTCSFHC